MSATELSRLRKSFLFLPILVIAATLACQAHIRSVGSCYQLVLDPHAYGGTELHVRDLSIEPASMARVAAVAPGPDGTALVTFEALHEGSGQVTVKTAHGGGSLALAVRPHNVIVCDGVNFTGWEWIAASIVVVLVALSLACAHAAFVLLHHAWYGHEMITYVGGAFFCAIEAVSFALAALDDTSGHIATFALRLTSIAEDFVELTLLPMGLAAALVCLSNIALVRHEGLRPVNVLGIACSLAWMAANALVGLLQDVTLTTLDADVFWFSLLTGSALSSSIAFVETLLIATCVSAWLASRHRPSAPRDAIIVLGCGIRADGTPTPLLAGRIDAALSYADSQERQGLGALTIVASGGKGADEPVSEAASIAGYLTAKGVAHERILLEEHSSTTNENFRFSRAVLEDAGCATDRIAFATTNYHVFRGYVCAHDAGLVSEGIAAPTRPYFWPNAFLREVAGIVCARWPHVLATLILTMALYASFEYVLLVG